MPFYINIFFFVKIIIKGKDWKNIVKHIDYLNHNKISDDL